jgi:hypothetical protein
MNDLILSKLEVEKLEVAEVARTGVQTLGDEAATISDNVSYVNFNADVSEARIITMPAALRGRNFRCFFSVEQGTDSRVFTRAGSDTFEGNIFTSQEGNNAGDGDVVAIANTTVTITTLGDTNIGSYIDFFCMADGRWSVTGHLVLDAVGKVPTLA